MIKSTSAFTVDIFASPNRFSTSSISYGYSWFMIGHQGDYPHEIAKSQFYSELLTDIENEFNILFEAEDFDLGVLKIYGSLEELVAKKLSQVVNE